MTVRRAIESELCPPPVGGAGRAPQLRPPDGLAATRFRLGSEEFLLLSFDAPDDRAASQCMQGLTSSERTVACLALTGLSNADIAELRGTSAGTIANQLTAIYRKLGLGSRRELRAYRSQRAGRSP